MYGYIPKNDPKPVFYANQQDYTKIFE